MAVKGERREALEDFSKKIGMVEVKVIAINPTEKEYDEVLGIELKEGSKAATYVGESKDGNPYIRLDFWLETVPDNQKMKVSYFLEDKKRVNKDGTKQQFINDIGICSWGADDSNLPSWFAKRSYRSAKSGEEDLYTFLRNWISLDYSKDTTELELDWKKTIKGDVSELKDLIDDSITTSFIVMATVNLKENDDNTVTAYQGVYNKATLPLYTKRHFEENDFSDPAVLAKINAKESKDLKAHERFVKDVTGEYGCKDIYTFKMLEDYIADDHMAASNSPVGGAGIHEEDPEY